MEGVKTYIIHFNTARQSLVIESDGTAVDAFAIAAEQNSLPEGTKYVQIEEIDDAGGASITTLDFSGNPVEPESPTF